MSDMKPLPEDTTIKLPVTFDYHGGRSDNFKSNAFLLGIVVGLSIFLLLFVSKNDNYTLIEKIIFCSAVVFLAGLFIRFKLLRELVYSKAYKELKRVDYTPSTASFWGMYEIEDEYPFLCHFVDNKVGIFISLVKDVVVGKSEDIMYRHYEAISDAYNLAGGYSLNMVHIDYMDNVGNDTRLNSLFESTTYCENSNVKMALLDMYSNLQDEMSKNYASYDVYLFTSKGNEDQLWYNVQSVVSCMLQGNYVSYKVLNAEATRTVCKAVFNLHEFSTIDACSTILKGRESRLVVPIKVEHYNNTVDILNKTQEEKRQEELQKQEAIRNRSRAKSKDKDSESIDLFK